MTPLYYEDIKVDEVRDLGHFHANEDEIVEFAIQYDPQPIHVDKQAARESIHGGIIASGWYTASMCMKLLTDGLLSNAASMGSFGLDELRWPTPVRPGDSITVQSEIIGKRESNSRSDRGYVKNELIGHNQSDEEVIFWKATNIFRKKS